MEQDASISCAKVIIALGVRKENIVMLDSRGVISNKRKDLTKEKEFLLQIEELKHYLIL